MRAPRPLEVLHILDSLEWSGHVELPNIDRWWLAQQLAAHFSSGSLTLCESCGTAMPICVSTPIGRLCTECLEEFTEQADAMRNALEE